MSWASRRRATYLGGVLLFFAALIAFPVLHYFFSLKPTCFDGKQDQGETAVDEGGPCVKLNPADLSPANTLWARSFKVRDGSYTSVAYVTNANQDAGILSAGYRFTLYDQDNVLIAEREGTTFVLPGGITPVVEIGIDTGNRAVVHTNFQLTDATPDWERVVSPALDVHISNQETDTSGPMPRVSAVVENTSFASMRDASFAAVVFDQYGNAMAASKTAVPSLDPSVAEHITLTWPGPFAGSVGRVDIVPLIPPVLAKASP